MQRCSSSLVFVSITRLKKQIANDKVEVKLCRLFAMHQIILKVSKRK